MKQHEDHIREAVRKNGPFSHNIIGISLSIIADKGGVAKANALVDKYNLTELYGIEKQDDRRPR